MESLVLVVVLVFLALMGDYRTWGLPQIEPSADVCADGAVYDVDMRMCVDCEICDDFPETSICSQCGVNWGMLSF